MPIYDTLQRTLKLSRRLGNEGLHRRREEASTWLGPVNIGAKAASHGD